MPRAHSPEGALFTDIVLEIFRLNGALLAAGNRLSKSVGLTSARWQVVGAVALAGRPLTVAQIAREMGLTRQSVQRIVDELEQGELVRRTSHPDSRRARPVELTEQGRAAYTKVTGLQQVWANRSAKSLSPKHLTAVRDALRTLRARLGGSNEGGPS